MTEPDRSSRSNDPDLTPGSNTIVITPKLGRVRSGRRIKRDPSGLWLRLTIGSIAVHGLILTIVLAASYRASEAHRAAVNHGDGIDLGAIKIGVIALPDRDTGTQIDPNSASNAQVAAPQTAPQTTPSIETNTTSNISDITNQLDPNTTPPSNPSPSPINPTPTPVSTPPPTRDDTDQGEPEDQGEQGHQDGNPADGLGETSGGNAGEDPTEPGSQGNDSDSSSGNSSDSPTGNGEDTTTSNGDDRLGLIVRLSPLLSSNTDPDRNPAQLTAPAANIDLPVNADPALLPAELAIPFAIELHIELSIDPNGIPSLVRVLEPDRDRELPQFEPFVETLIEDWRFEAASSVANGREVDQLDLVLALQWR
ncbi:MAG: hypothetical protein HC795_03720 [Coleofasciculaceae cyanobacterium RL_1_1]|nr:hypothetical protein [Coleofasciculaceae cyanobacterium RL_1_1]